MLRAILAPVLFVLFLSNTGDRRSLPAAPKRTYIACDPGIRISLDQLPRIPNTRIVYSDEKSIYPVAIANDNTVPAGILRHNDLRLNLEVVMSNFYPEGPARPGVRMATIREKGKAPSVPAPLIRIRTGVRIHATLHNSLTDSTITFFGFQKRPSASYDSILLKPGETKQISFEAGDAGTYLYGAYIHPLRDEEEQQLGGAFIIDPKEGSLPDRVLVINNSGYYIDTSYYSYGYIESLTINGGSWPNTERITPSVGDTVRWRVINASNRRHPMHLHGFNFALLSMGTGLTDSIYKPGYQPSIVTQSMSGQTTMSLQWIAKRPGNWLFHCHLSFHVTPDIRLPGAEVLDAVGQTPHMAGLVMGITVKPGPSDLISKGPPKEYALYTHQYTGRNSTFGRFTFAPDVNADTDTSYATGPLLLMKQYQPTYVTVENRMPIPTSVHWHGLDLDSWADGVPDWSASDGKMSPSIPPGGKFTYKLTLMRPGTYIYHSHFDDVRQIASGLYGPLVVMPENKTYDPKTDHVFILGWRNREVRSFEDDMVLNGNTTQPDQLAHTGESHRLRLINIQPAGDVMIRINFENELYPIRSLAKDGTDLPLIQQAVIRESPAYGVGETADFEFKPLKPGIYTVEIIIPDTPFKRTQKWIVKE